MEQTVSIRISGKVQGVFFRQSTREKAKELNITGFVRNEPDDTVSIIATGKEEQLQLLLAWCHEGPPRAQVKNVRSENIPLRHFTDFSIQRF